jgi:DNA-directed RNA polymerase specialized sigma24 family protein
MDREEGQPRGHRSHHGTNGGSGDPLPTTRWSEVARAADADPAVRRAALERLVGQYLPAFRAHLTRRRGLSPHDADDVLQGFVCDQVVVAGLLAGADRDRGRLRAYLFAAIENHLSRVRRYDRAAKRAPASRPLSLDDHGHDNGDQGAGGGPGGMAAAAGEADVFDLEWARRVLGETADRMRADSAARPDPDRQRAWALFEMRVLRPTLDGDEPPPYAEVVRRLGFASPAQASNALVTGKRTFARLLRAVIGEYAADPGEVEAELNDLWAAVSARAPDARVAQARPAARAGEHEGS